MARRLADYKQVKKFTLREDEFPKPRPAKIKRYIVEPEISSRLKKTVTAVVHGTRGNTKHTGNTWKG